MFVAGSVIPVGAALKAGEPNPTGYLTTKLAIDRVGNDATKVFQGLQVKP